jgi:hypothetical protein
LSGNGWDEDYTAPTVNGNGWEQDYTAQQGDSFIDDAIDVAGEFAAAANRAALSVPDMIPNAINAGLSLAGADTRLPTLTGAMESTGIQGGFMEPGTARNAVVGAGIIPVAAAALKQVAGRNLAKAGDAALEFAGVGQSAPAARVAANLPATIDGVVLDQGGDAARRQAVNAQNGDIAGFGFKLNQFGEQVKDGYQINALKKGWDKPVIVAVKDATPATKEAMKKMVDVVEGGMNNGLYRMDSRPLDIAGNAMAARIRIVEDARQSVGKRLGDVAADLKSEAIDVNPQVGAFVNNLRALGVEFAENGKPLYDAADFQGSKAAESMLNRIMLRMKDTQNASAYDVHR